MIIKNKNDFDLHFDGNECLTAKMLNGVNCDYSVLYNKLEAGKSSRPHSHDSCDELYYVVDGTGTLKVDEETKVVKTGDLVVIPKNSCHSITNESDTPIEFLTIGFRKGFYDEWNVWVHALRK